MSINLLGHATGVMRRASPMQRVIVAGGAAGLVAGSLASQVESGNMSSHVGYGAAGSALFAAGVATIGETHRTSARLSHLVFSSGLLATAAGVGAGYLVAGEAERRVSGN
jgi:hypothetical protein